MKIRPDKVMIGCSTCKASIVVSGWRFDSQWTDVEDVEKQARQSSLWKTERDPEGLTCNCCQQEAARQKEENDER